MMAERAKLTKTFVDGIAFAEKGQAFYWDADLPGFGMRVGIGSKAWFVEKRIGHKTTRVTIGKYPAVTAKQARDEAMAKLGKMAAGINPTQEKREARIKSVTLQAVFAEFLAARQLKPKTVKDYTAVINGLYADWLKKPITAITKDMVEKRHKKIGSERGEAYANLAARTLRSVLNFASAKYEDSKGASILPDNPVRRISQTRAWYRVERRTGHLKNHQLKPWFDAVLSIENATIRDYLQFVLLTGCRKEEAAQLQWADVDLADGSYVLRDPKNHRPIRLPLSDYLLDMLKRRQKDGGGYVFPGNGATGYLVEPKRQVGKVGEQIGMEFSMHDLRRSFVTIAESLDISAFALKALVNHKHKADGDVTGGYVQLNVERLRDPMQRITDFVLKSAGVKETATVIDLNEKRA